MSTSTIFTIEITMTFHFSIISVFIIFLHIYNMLYFFHNSFSSFGSSIIFKCSIFVNSKSIKYHPISYNVLSKSLFYKNVVHLELYLTKTKKTQSACLFFFCYVWYFCIIIKSTSFLKNCFKISTNYEW